MQAEGFDSSALLFIFSLAVLVKGLENAGVTAFLGEALTEFSTRGAFSAILATVVATSIGSNLINNWSMMMVSVASLGQVDMSGTGRALVYSSIMGSDLGQNISILGSLSSMLWLVLLRQRGLDVRPVSYLKIGLLVTPPMLLAGALAIYAASLF